MGQLVVASHESLAKDFEVSCEELDYLVSAALSVPGVLGARMMGGGFGGCTINLMAPSAERWFREHLAEAYTQQYGQHPEIYPCVPSAGAGSLL